MNSNKLRKIIIICAIVSSMIIAIIVLLLLTFNSKTEDDDKNTNYSVEYEVNANNKKRPEKKESEVAKENEYNKLTIQAVTEDSLLSNYLEDFKYNALHHLDDSYNSLNEEYRSKKFGSIENYEKYIKNRYDILNNIKLNKYKINKYDNYEQYICLDQYENYYIFNKLPDMSYSVILDTYTIDLPQFLEKYNKANDGEKTGLNIDKFIEAINQKDYEYAFNVLDSSFKENNDMSNINEFEEYVKHHFFEKNGVGHISAEKEENYIIYKAKIIDKSLNEESKNITFVMKLLENTDFVMSFSFE